MAYRELILQGKLDYDNGQIKLNVLYGSCFSLYAI